MSDTQRQRIVILGGGFAGAAVAGELARLLPDEPCDITLIDRDNFSLFTPMLTEVVGGDVAPDGIVAAIRALSPRIAFEQGRVTAIDAAAKRVEVTVGDTLPGVEPARRSIEADHLVIALGSITNFHHIPGLSDHSLTIKTVDDAQAIRNRAIALLERADEEPDAARRRALLTFVVGGGGFSGVETMAALNDLVRDLAGRFHRIEPRDVRCVLVQPGDRILPELDAGLASYAQRQLERRGVEVMLHTEVTGADGQQVEIKNGRTGTTSTIATHTLIWAGGVKPTPVIDSAGLPRGHHGGIAVDSCCAVPGHPGIWALGDCAEVPRPGSRDTYAPTAQNATREGTQVARNIAAVMHGQQPQPFVYQPVGQLALVGKRTGVASLYGFHISGLAAWAMWRAIYLAKLPRTAQRVRVGLDWLIDLAFGREIATLPGIDGRSISGGAGGSGSPVSSTTKETRPRSAPEASEKETGVSRPQATH